MRDGTLKGGAFDGASGGNHTTATHHSIRLHDTSPYFPTFATATPPVAPNGNGQLSMSQRSTPPALASGTGTPSSDVSYHSQPLPERFHWTTESQAATAIRG